LLYVYIQSTKRIHPLVQFHICTSLQQLSRADFCGNSRPIAVDPQWNTHTTTSVRCDSGRDLRRCHIPRRRDDIWKTSMGVASDRQKTGIRLLSLSRDRLGVLRTTAAVVKVRIRSCVVTSKSPAMMRARPAQNTDGRKRLGPVYARRGAETGQQQRTNPTAHTHAQSSDQILRRRSRVCGGRTARQLVNIYTERRFSVVLLSSLCGS